MNKLIGNPYRDKGTPYFRLLVKPTPRETTEQESGVITPESMLNIHETGIVVSICEGSTLKEGDEVVYSKIDRNSDQYDKVIIDYEQLDSVYEKEIWAVNEKPFGRIFVDPISELSVTESGIAIPEQMKGLPAKGVVFMAPEDSYFKAGDIIEYRKQENGIYPTVILNGGQHEVLWPDDVFTYNGVVSPYRIIIQFDLLAAAFKKRESEGGVVRAPSFEYMLYNLQYGEIKQIGSEAQKHYPELNVGDLAIVHHTVESQQRRVLSFETAKQGIYRYENRMIDSFSPNSREIFGKINKAKLDNKIETGLIMPFHNNVFLKWRFDLFEGLDEDIRKADLLAGTNFDLSECHDIGELNHTIERNKKKGVNTYKTKFNAHLLQLQQLDPEQEINREDIEVFEAGIEQLRRGVLKASGYVNKNHVLHCKVASPAMVLNHVLVCYKELYPIDILGKKYLIANEKFIIAHIYKDYQMPTEIVPYGDRVLVLPVEESSASEVIIPDSAKEAPMRGVIIAVGPKGDSSKKPDDVAFYKRNTGIPLKWEGKEYLLLEDNALLCWINPLVAEA